MREPRGPNCSCSAPARFPSGISFNQAGHQVPLGVRGAAGTAESGRAADRGGPAVEGTPGGSAPAEAAGTLVEAAATAAAASRQRGRPAEAGQPRGGAAAAPRAAPVASS